MSMYIDFHSHVLPEIDDGSSSLEESYSMLKAEASQGVRHVVATPHFYARRDSVEFFLKKRGASAQAVKKLLAHDTELPGITLGAEVYYFAGMSDADILSQLTIGDSKYILVEMPSPPWTESMYHELASIWERQRLVPILAHIDRYIAPFRTYGIPKRIADMPVLVQANASFFLDKRSSSMAFKMLSAGKIHLLGSDAHNMRSRSPNLGQAMDLIELKLGKRAVSAINSRGARILGLE